MENNIESIIENEIKFCEENGFEWNEHGVYIYKSSNGASSINLPYILRDYNYQYLEEHGFYTISDLKAEWQKGYDEGFHYNDGFYSSSKEDITLKDLEYEFSVKTIKVETPYDEMKFNILKNMFEKKSLEQLENLIQVEPNDDFAFLKNIKFKH